MKLKCILEILIVAVLAFWVIRVFDLSVKVNQLLTGFSSMVEISSRQGSEIDATRDSLKSLTERVEALEKVPGKHTDKD